MHLMNKKDIAHNHLLATFTCIYIFFLYIDALYLSQICIQVS